MLKKIVLLTCLSLGMVSFAQTDPTLVSYQKDTICSDSYDYGVYNLVVEDLDNDSTYINIVSYDSGLLGYTYVVVPDTYNPSSSLRTFKIEVYVNTSIPAGVTLTDIDIEIVGGSGDDFTTFETLSGIGVRKGPDVTMDFSSAVFCSNGNPVDPAPYVTPAGGTFSYNDGTELSYFDPKLYYQDPGDGIFYTVVDAFGCQGYYMQTVSVAAAPTVSVIANPSTCGNADGNAVAVIIGDALPFTAYWTTGFSEVVSSSSTVNNLSSGNYYVNVTDNNGCKAVGIAQVSDNDLDVTETITNESCLNQSFNGAIDLNVLSTNGTVDYIFWSNGQTTEDISGLHAGDYSVHIHTSMNCQGFYTYTVDAFPKLDVSIDNIMDADCTLPDGGSSGIEITTYGGTGNYSWLWNTGVTTEDIYNIPTGIYTCTVTDNTTGCNFTWSKNLGSFNGPAVYIDAVTKPTCNSADGMINAGYYSPSPIASLSWNTGQLTEDISNIPAGTYVLTVTDINGCMGYDQVILPYEKPYQPSICLLTVDSSLTYNTVVWEKDFTQDIAGFNVYRETSTFGVFEQVANRPFALESFYQDNVASPMDRSWRYYLTTYDNCGNESFPSFVHKTIHVVTNTSNGIDFDLSWDDYEGIDYTTVDLYRFDEVNGWLTISSLPYGTHTYTDTPPVVAGLDYMVSFNLGSPCTSSKVQDHNSSRSNKTASVFDPGGSTATIEDEELGIISIYPNPATDMITLHVDKPEMFNTYEIVDLNGNIVASGTIFTNNTTVATEFLASGVYMVRLKTDSKVILEKIVKN